MSLETSEALVLRVIPFRDTSKIVTAYSAEQGLLSLLAKGVRAARPRFGSALEIFAVIDVVYYHKESRELQLLSQATLLEAHLGLTRHPRRYAFGTAVLEFLLRTLHGQEPPGRLYALAVRALEVLETAPIVSLPAVFRAFEIKAISFLGHRPQLSRCVECGDDLVHPGNDLAFSATGGGVVCPVCRALVPDALALAAPALRELRHLMSATLADVAHRGLATGPGVGRVVEVFLQAHVERYESLRAMRLVAALAAPDASRIPDSRLPVGNG